MLVLAALENWHITGIDVKTAFLYGKLNEDVTVAELFTNSGLYFYLSIMCHHSSSDPTP